MRYKSIFLGDDADIKSLSCSVRDFYLGRGYSVEIYQDSKKRTVVNASRKRKRLHSVFFSRKGGAVEVESRTYYIVNNILIFASLTVIQACLGRMIGGMIGADSLLYAIGILMGITESLIFFSFELRENKGLRNLLSASGVKGLTV
ncbi:MAG: hypothetical protein K5930_11885 [Treponemataceae bacterium]|nr:hypothetical protein [Treponemataceae bacterium]